MDAAGLQATDDKLKAIMEVCAPSVPTGVAVFSDGVAKNSTAKC